MRDEDISMISFDGDASTVAERLYTKYHPFVWMILMLMAVTLHNQYKDLFAGKELLNVNNNFSREDHIQRQVTERDQVKSQDLSSIVMSLIQPEVNDSSSTQTFLRGISQLLSTLTTEEPPPENSRQVSDHIVQPEELVTTTADSTIQFEPEGTTEAVTISTERTHPDENHLSKRNLTTAA
jgi:hypothetical protein